jgi:NADPH:quinone reductase-like Zn-dependent oxidoreductase
MRAVVHDRYGPPDVLRVAEVARPVPKEDELLVRVEASTVTRGEAMGVRGVEYRFTRLFTGVRRPRQTAFGSELAGGVEEVGAAVTISGRRRRPAVGAREDLVLVKELVDTGKYRPVIDRTYLLDDVVEATRYVETGQKTGNVVLRVEGAAAGRQP